MITDTTVSLINYHFVFCPRYRRKIFLIPNVEQRYKEMTKMKKYRNLISSLSNDKKKDKDIWKKINEIRKEYRMSEYSFHEDIKQMR